MLHSLRTSLAICFSLALACGGAQAQARFANGRWDLSADFSGTHNPSGAWSYGWTESDGSRFTLGTRFDERLEAWGGFRAGDGNPSVTRNGTDTTIWVSSTLFWEPGETLFHPGPGNERAVVRWTAPSNGAFAVQSRFSSKDLGATDVSMVVNGTLVFAANLDYDWSAARYEDRLVLAAGDTVDFTVGYGTDGSFNADSTGIAVTVALADCGNGRLDAGEECDDGNTNPSDGCTNACTVCGNRLVAQYEQCDDGNRVNGDGCDSNCTTPACGNGIRTAGEQCDDGNRNDSDGCTNACTVCGDGVVTSAEHCDDGNHADGDCCSSRCRLPVGILAGPVVNPANKHRYYLLAQGRWPASEAEAVCLGGYLAAINTAAEQTWVWEQFSQFGGVGRDLWIGLNDAATEGTFVWTNGEPVTYTHWGDRAPDHLGENEDYVHMLLWVPDGVWDDYPGDAPERYGAPLHGVVEVTDCGDGVRQADQGEECDDGNANPADGCTNWCTVCGNGVVTPYEHCDDGNLTDHDGCNADCQLPICGDRIVDRGEQCDDGNVNPCDGCSPTCRSEPVQRCGDGVLSTACGEECDDGNLVDGDTCEADCTVPRCGNGIRDAGEGCDDGNRVDGDGCEADCTVPRCGNGIRDDSEECDDGNWDDSDGCTNACTICGNGIVTSPETCDDGNRNTNDFCRNDCRPNVCGDGVRNPATEECDDWNRNPLDGCTNDCTACGEGVVTVPEECDDGGTSSACDAGCRRWHDVGRGTPQSCTDAAFDAALANGSVSFYCGPDPVTITVRRAKAIAGASTVDGGGLVSLSGGGEARIFTVDGGAVLDVRNLTITNAYAAGWPDGGSGGILNYGTLTLTNCTVSDNSSGGIGNHGTLTIIDSTFSDNIGVSGGLLMDGGAVVNNAGATLTVTNSSFLRNGAFSGGAIFNSGTLKLTDCTLSANSVGVRFGEGGGIYNLYDATADVTRCTFSANSGAGIYGGRTVTVTDSTFSGNSGGGIVGGATLTVSNSTFSGNSESGILGAGTTTVTNCGFSGNNANGDRYGGGGIFNVEGATLTVANSTFSGNSATHGGGILNVGIASVSNSTIVGNSGHGGGILNGTCGLAEDCSDAMLTVSNSIVANNTDGDDCVNAVGTVTDGGYNLMGNAANACGLTNGVNGNLVGVDPKLATLGNNGGPTQTIAVLPGSPAIDAGDPEVCANPPVNGVDQRGYVRPGAGSANCAMGAYEYDSPGPPPGCVGDCQGDGAVTVDELLTMVNIALGEASISTCDAGDPNGGGSITVGEIIMAGNAALSGCDAS